MRIKLASLLAVAWACAMASVGMAAEPAPGHFLVIGSFSNAANAARWADYNEAFGTEVLRERIGRSSTYRVLVGPLSAAAAPYMQAILSGAGIERSWPLTRCADGPAVAGIACPALAGTTAIAER